MFPLIKSNSKVIYILAIGSFLLGGIALAISLYRIFALEGSWSDSVNIGMLLTYIVFFTSGVSLIITAWDKKNHGQ
jgi:hypothetical protein